MHCPNCNRANDPDALFCSECGAADVNEPKSQPAKARRAYLFVLLLLPVIAVAAGLGYYKFFLPEGVAAVVNGEEIKSSELDAAVARREAVYGRAASTGAPAEQETRRLRYQALAGLITERLLLQEAHNAGIVIPSEEVAAAFARARAASGMDKDSFDSSVMRLYGSKQSFEEALQRELVINTLISQKVVPQGAYGQAAGAAVDRWMQDLTTRSAVRIALSEQWSGAGSGCCNRAGGPQRQACGKGCGNTKAAVPGRPGINDAAEAGLKFWHEKHGAETVAAKLTDFGCHIQVDILKDKKRIGSLRYQGGNITEQ